MQTVINKKWNLRWTLLVITGLILIVFFISMNLGTIRLTPLEIIQTLVGAGSAQQELILFQFRLPRILLACLVGACLAVAGAILQGISRNDLADPGILGINQGAGFAIVLFIYFTDGAMLQISNTTTLTMPIFAFVGAGVAATLVYLLAWKRGITPTRLVLVGIGIHAAFSSTLLIFQLNLVTQDFNQVLVWLSGSIWGTDWTIVYAVLPWILLLLPFAIYKARYLDVLSLGDMVATELGTSVEKERRILLVLAVGLAGVSVAAAGGISFLGLIAPHLARRIVGPHHKKLIPTSALIGVLLLLVSDMIGKNLLSPTEIPVGLVVAIVGAPYFLYLFMKR